MRFLLTSFFLFSCFFAQARHLTESFSSEKTRIGNFCQSCQVSHQAKRTYLIELRKSYIVFSDKSAYRPVDHYGFTGRYKDVETGLWYFRARYYSDELGRFISRDPLGFVDGMSLYAGYFAQYFAMDPFGKNALGDFFREYLPPIVGVPLGGVTDTVGGLGEAAVGAVTLDGDTVMNGLSDTGHGLLSTVGLDEALTEDWVPSPTGTIPLPESLSELVADSNAQTDCEHAADANNGMHGWHASTNAALASELGPFMAPFQFLGGIAHELDPGAVSAEVGFQGPLNATLDATGDIVANTLGIVTGLIVPPALSPASAGRNMGNLVPGPRDPDPTGQGLMVPMGGSGTSRGPVRR